MAIITFWSNSMRETAKTSSMAAIATHMAVEHNFKIIMISTIYKDNTLEDFYWNKKEDSVLSEIAEGKRDIASGVDGIVQLTISNKLTPQNITNYAQLVFPENRLELIIGSQSDDFQNVAREKNIFKDIIENANQYYDYVFVDLDKGLERYHVREILDISDLIIVNTTQKLTMIRDLEKIKKENEFLNKDNVFVLLGRYDKFSKYNSKNVARTLGYKNQTLAVPYNTLFFEACGEGKVADYFLRYRKLKPDDRNALFISEIEYAENTMIDRIKLLQNFRH